MIEGIPVTIHLDRPTFIKLEKLAGRKQVTMRQLIERHLTRSLERTEVEHGPRQRRKYVRLTDAQVAEARSLTRDGWTMRDLAERYGCSVSLIRDWRRKWREAEK